MCRVCVSLHRVGKPFHGIMVSVLWYGMVGMVSITIIIIIITIANFPWPLWLKLCCRIDSVSRTTYSVAKQEQIKTLH